METNTFDKIVSSFGFGKYQYIFSLILSQIPLADGAEIQILSLLLPILKSNFEASSFSISLLGSLVFLGYAIGGATSGFWSLYLGRRKSIIMITFLWSIFAFLSGISSTIYEFMVYRFLFAIGVGTAWPISFSMITEVCPVKNRGKYCIFFQLFYPLGEIFAVILSYFTINDDYINDWRVLIFTTSVFPIFSFVVCLVLLDDTARELILNNKLVKGVLILKKMEKYNMKNVKTSVLGESTVKEIEEWAKEIRIAEGDTEFIVRDQFRILFQGDYKIITPLLWIVWFSTNFLYYGIVFILPLTLDKFEINTNETFQSLLIVNSAEFVTSFVNMFIIDLNKIGRKYTIIIFNFFTLLSFIVIIFELKNGFVIWISLAKSFQNINFNTLYVWTSEIYPTKIRTMGIGFATLLCRIGPCIVTWIAVYLLDIDVILPYVIFAIVSLISTSVTLLIKFETLNVELDTFIKQQKI